MTSQALYNKWRGQAFGEILGQEHITRTLRNQIRSGRIGHAYLFTGLRGTGKTSTARIMAKAVNCVGDTDDPPCNACHICHSITSGASMDLIEIDAASNRGIDEIRDLRDRVAFAPHETRFKVYVIDEVHMLTNEAFNALLKTLEEPPSHVIFILCTTEPHRLPDTILSRCQRFDFRRGSVATLSDKLRLICHREEIHVTDEALEYIARRATGSFRDAESLLDQLSAYQTGEIDLALVQDVLGSVPLALIARLVEALITADVPAGVRAINEAIDSGAEPRQFLSEILDYLRGLLLVRVGAEENLQHLGPEGLEEMRRVVAGRSFSADVLIRAIRLFNEAGQGLRTAARPQLPLELAFIDAVLQSTGGDAGEAGPSPRREVAPAVESTSGGRGAARTRPPVAEPVAVTQPPRKSAAGGSAGDGDAESFAVAQAAKAAAPPEAGKAAPSRERPAAGRGSERVDDSPRAAGRDNPPQKVAPEPPAAVDPPSAGQSPPAAEASAATAGRTLTLDWVRNNWNLILMKVQHRNRQVRALMSSCYPVSVRDDVVTLGCEADFHRNMLSDAKRLGLVDQVMTEVLGIACRGECVVQPDLRELMSGTRQAPAGAATDLFDAPPTREIREPPPAPLRDGQDDERERLLNHPIVKELQKRGGRVARVRLYDDAEGLAAPPPATAGDGETDDETGYETDDDED
jgi:DNA polymerase-3 subunit gamma/tau